MEAFSGKRVEVIFVRHEWQKKLKNWVQKWVKQAAVGEEWVSEAKVVGEDEILQGCRSTICNRQDKIHRESKRNCQSGEPNLLSLLNRRKESQRIKEEWKSGEEEQKLKSRSERVLS